MPFSTYLANRTLEHVVGKTAFTMPTNYLGLMTAAPNINGSGVVEPAGGGYSRVATSAAAWGTAASGSISNTATFTFPTATGDWATQANMTHGGGFDAQTAGNLLYFGALTTAKPVLNGDTVSIAPGGVTISLS